jgi:antitoxin (DNA-binding transcriptional repressor) of toxin-antitoxin stability system
MNVSVRELKAHLSEYLCRVQAGEEFDVTLRGRPIARLGATLAARQSDDPEAAVRAQLGSLSWVRLGSGGKPEGLDPPLALKSGEKPLSQILLEERE